MGLDRQDEFVIPPRKNVRLCHFSGIDASDGIQRRTVENMNKNR
jgi:hypothetical protein